MPCLTKPQASSSPCRHRLAGDLACSNVACGGIGGTSGRSACPAPSDGPRPVRAPRRRRRSAGLDVVPARPRLRANAGVVDVGQGLGGGELRRALHGPHLPGDLVEVVVVQDGDDQPGVGPLLPVMRDRDQLGHAVHLHRAVTDQGDRRPVGVRPLRADHVRHAWPHGGQRARQRTAHVAAEFQVAGIPVRRADPDRRRRSRWRACRADSSWKIRIGLTGSASSPGAPWSPTSPRRCLDLPPRPVGLASQQRHQRLQCRPRVAEQYAERVTA